MDDATRRSLAAQLAVGLASFLTPFTYGALSVAMPTIGRQFDFSAREMAMVMMIHLLFSTSFVLLAGRVSDIIGRKGLFMSGSLLFTAASLTAGLAAGPDMLFCARGLQGVGDAMTFGVSGAILVTVVPPERTGRAIGFNLMFVYAGLALGPLVGGVLTSLFSWRVVFFASALAGLAAFELIRRGYGEQPGERGPLPLADGLVFVPAVFGLMLGLSVQPSLWGAVVTVLSGALMLWFLKRQQGVEHPLVDVRYVKANRPFALSNLAAVLGYAAAFSTSFLLSLLLQNVHGFSASDAGYMLLVMPAVQTAASPLTGRLSDAVSPERASAAGLVVLGAGFAALAVAGQGGTAWVLWVQVVLGSGFALFVTPNFNAIMACAGPKRKGMASGFMTTMRGAGMCLSMSLTGLVLALALGSESAAQAGPDILPALRACFGLFALVSCVAAWSSWRAGSARAGAGAVLD